MYSDAIHHFSSVESRDAPQYCGLFACGTIFGKKFEIDGKAFEVVDGKLYVNKNVEVYKAWKEDVSTHIEQAHGKWSTVKNIAASEL